MTPAENGRELEEIIYNKSLNIPGLKHSKREIEIRRHFNDHSLNGVDHLISVGKYHVLIQDKWKETTGQQEASQFLIGAKRISDKIPRSEDILKIWASKTEPTANSRKILEEENVTIIVSDFSLEDLANKVMYKVYKYFGIDISQPFDSEIEKEARELLQIKNELKKKKELEEEKRIKDEEALEVILNSTAGIGVGVAVAGTGVGVNVGAAVGVAVGTDVGTAVGHAITTL